MSFFLQHDFLINFFGQTEYSSRFLLRGSRMLSSGLLHRERKRVGHGVQSQGGLGLNPGSITP